MHLQTDDLPTTQVPVRSDAANKTRVTVDKVDAVFEYLGDYGVLVCKEHGYAVRALDDHLKRLHRTTVAGRKAIAAHLTDRPILHPTQVPLPPPLEPPFDCLGPPKRAYICDEDECDELSINRDVIRIHCNRAHGWKSTPEQRTHWHEQWVQTFFNAAGLQRYFTVSYESPSSPRKKGGQVVTLDPEDDRFSSILSEWDQDLEKQRKALEIADREVAKTDHTLWFKRNEWPEHLAGCNLRHLSRISRLPDKEERVLQRAVELNVALIEACVAGLKSLDRETRRWLRSAKLSEIDQRPLARLQNPESQQTYSTYFSRLLCYSLRVLHSEAETEGQGDQSDSSSSSDEDDEGEDSSSEEDNDDNGLRSETAVDVFLDARRLYPWQWRQKELLSTVQQSIDRGWDDKAQMKALLAWYGSLIFQKVRADVFKSVFMHFLAVLGINEEDYRLRQANDFSYMLAGIVYCTRVIGVEVILPVSEREDQGDEDDKRFRRMRDEYLADGTYSVMSKMLSLLAYGKSVAMSHNNAGMISFSLNRTVMNFRGKPINLSRFSKMVQDVVAEAEDKLWGELMWTKRDDRFEIPLESLVDDVTFTKRGVSFITHGENGLDDKRQWMLKQAYTHAEGRKLRRGDSWAKPAVQRYLRQIDRFRELLLFCVHVTGGQPARGSEITTVRFRNGYMQDRNVFIIQGHMVIVTRYHKSQSQFDKPKVIPRFLPWRVGQLLAVYLAYVQPLQQWLGEKVRGLGVSDYVWSSEYGPWGTDRLTKIIARETEKALGWRLTTLDYRHVAISLGREKVGERFAQGYAEQSDEVEEPEMDGDDGLEISAGRGGEIGANRYGVSLEVIKHLSSRSIDTFRPLSMQWHRFLGLESSRPGSVAGQKRGAHMRSDSSGVSGEVEHERRKQALMFLNNGIHGWMEMLEQFRQQPVPSNGMPVSSEPSYGRSTPHPSINPQLPSTPYMSGRGGLITPGESHGLEASPLWSRSQAIAPVGARPTIGAAEMKQAMKKALRRDDVSFRSDKQREALEMIMNKDDFTPLVVVLPTGGGKSLLFTAPACLEDPGVTVVVVPYRALLNRLLQTAQEAGIDCFEWKRGEVNPAALVFVSADVVQPFMSYARVMDGKGLLRRVFVDESHLTFTSSNWRAKLTTVRLVRGLRAPTIMLTATLPVTLEFELEEQMAAQMARYVRMVTTRPRTRYTVDTCPAGTGPERTLDVCRRMTSHLGRQKGVVYSRSRQGCERLAAELECAYYHAGAVDNQERLDRWLDKGGLIVATSALGTGVVVPGVVFVLHTDVPYGMIDFAQESGRGGRAGEDVDSLIIVEEGRVEMLAELSRGVGGIDQQVMDEFITTRECRRLVMSRYLDGQEIHCESEAGMARCDRCGGGLTELERQYARTARERQAFEEMLDEAADSCAACWMEFCDSRNASEMWDHKRTECRRREKVVAEAGSLGGVRFAADSHSCFRCGLSQRLCRTGQHETAACQWPGVMAGFVEVMWQNPQWEQTFGKLGWTKGLMGGGKQERTEWLSWVGQRHQRRVWGEVMSNGMAALIEFCRDVRAQYSIGDCREDKDRNTIPEETVDTSEGYRESTVVPESRRSSEGRIYKGAEHVRRVTEVLQRWREGCVGCRANQADQVGQHDIEFCPEQSIDDIPQAALYRAMVEQFKHCETPRCEQGGRCWVGWLRCERGRTAEVEATEGGRECQWSRTARTVVCALLSSRRQRQVTEWLIEHRFRGADGVEREQWQALAAFLAQPVQWDDVESNVMCEILSKFG